MSVYNHRVQYYETDRMGIVHHSNYVRWMEEARVDFLARLGFPYDVMEARGVISPVRAVRCQYRKSSTFGETVAIGVSVKDYNGVVLTVAYDMRNGAGDLLCAAESEHVFLSKEGRILRVARDLPDFHAALEALKTGGDNDK